MNVDIETHTLDSERSLLLAIDARLTALEYTLVVSGHLDKAALDSAIACFTAIQDQVGATP